MANDARIYLALGDSLSIDDYTGAVGGGAASQFGRMLGSDWTFVDRTYDGCRMAGVPRDGRGNIITLTIGGNDLLWNRERYLRDGLSCFAREHLVLLRAIRDANQESIFVVGDVYAPAMKLSREERLGLAQANAAIRKNCGIARATLAPIHDTFQGHEADFLCFAIEPTLKGATAIAELFRRAITETRGHHSTIS